MPPEQIERSFDILKERIKARAADKKRSGEAEKELASILASLSALEENLANNQEALGTAARELSETEKRLGLLASQRNELFGSKDPAETEK